jgi:L-ascorbate metabolism protein UlaG (beta-lactamase superfamily)
LFLQDSISTRIIADPFGNSIPGFYYSPDSLFADIVTVSHGYADHNQIATVHGSPLVLRTVIWSDTIKLSAEEYGQQVVVLNPEYAK